MGRDELARDLAPSDATIIAAQDETITALEDRLDTIRDAAAAVVEALDAGGLPDLGPLLTACQDPR